MVVTELTSTHLRELMAVFCSLNREADPTHLSHRKWLLIKRRLDKILDS